ncbi:hypothetical protein [Moraxella sp. ZY210820]|uniref:hypothetical protein n=1 Tax=unclassified Moraxella TaxID=2685852 RepID=UPI00272F42BF|nr:hypothetical protein [Moraxella sp. ZY210820]WLF83457.1 hypothetical protein LU301_09325 [Moraxella sp. ZY210820]
MTKPNIFCHSFGVKNNHALLLSCDVNSGLGHALSIRSADFNAIADYAKHQLVFYFNGSDRAYILKAKNQISAYEWTQFMLRLAGAQEIKIYHKNVQLIHIKPSIFSRKRYAKHMVDNCKAEHLNE